MDKIVSPIKRIVKGLKTGSKLIIPFSIDGSIETYTVKTIKDNPKLNHPYSGKFYEITFMENDTKLYGYENNVFIHVEGGKMGGKFINACRIKYIK